MKRIAILMTMVTWLTALSASSDLPPDMADPFQSVQWADASGPPDGQSEILDWARSFDPADELGIKKAKKDDYASAFGTIAVETCLKNLDDSQKMEAINALASDLAGSFQKIKACREHHPMLEGLLKDTVSILRRAIVVCRDSAEDSAIKKGYGGYTTAFHNASTPDNYGKDAGQHAGWGKLFYIVIPDNLHAFTDNEDYYRQKLYFHEALHYTGANNLILHNKIEKIPYKQDDPCAKNKLDDRIVFMEGVCGFNDYLAKEILHRMNRCDTQMTGEERGCVKTMAGLGPASFFGSPEKYGQVFNKQEAEILCLQIKQQIEKKLNPQTAIDPLMDKIIAINGEIIGKEPALSALAEGGLRGIPPHYLASLSPEEITAVNANDSFARDFQSCHLSPDGRLNPRHQDLPCPLADDHELFMIAWKFLAFNNMEANLYNGSIEITTSLYWLIRNSEITTEKLDEFRIKTESLYSDNCPSGPQEGRFWPPLCENGKSMILGLINDVRQAIQ
ncbi:MAG: hypothetical protein HY747_11725 [Elusimicrobia bacterium]|nr:hypothetical protein [Elusimicrobiota bacterium]